MRHTHYIAKQQQLASIEANRLWQKVGAEGPDEGVEIRMESREGERERFPHIMQTQTNLSILYNVIKYANFIWTRLKYTLQAFYLLNA